MRAGIYIEAKMSEAAMNDWLCPDTGGRFNCAGKKCAGWAWTSDSKTDGFCRRGMESRDIYIGVRCNCETSPKKLMCAACACGGCRVYRAEFNCICSDCKGSMKTESPRKCFEGYWDGNLHKSAAEGPGIGGMPEEDRE